MAATTLKTYQGDTMAAALAEVKKDLGSDAVILHTRTYRVGGVMGVGARNRVEITASADTGEVRPRRVRPRVIEPQTQSRPEATPGARALDRRPASEEFVPLAPWHRPEPSRPADSAPVAQPASAERVVRARADAPDPEPVREAVRARTPTAPLSAATVTPAPTTPEAHAAIEEELAAIRRLVGQVLQSTRRTEVRGGAATVDAPNAAGPLQTAHLCLLDGQVDGETADALAGAVRDALSPQELADARIVRDAVLREIARTIVTSDEQPPPETRGRPHVIALIGPTGVGKTTTVAKLAATFKLRHGRRVGLVTADTYRIAAVEQLRTYADIVGLPMKVALTPSDMAASIDSLSDCDVVLVDTAGRSHNDEARLGELARFLEAARPDVRHLALSLAASESVISAAAARFGALSPDRLILSKLDEAVDFGPIANIAARIGLPISYVTTGQEVPDHIEPACAERLARLVLDGREAWQARSRAD